MAPIRRSNQAIEAPPPMKAGDASPAPSRRSFVGSIGLMAFAVLPAWVTGAHAPQKFVLVDGWILADADLR